LFTHYKDQRFDFAWSPHQKITLKTGDFL